MDAVVRSDRPLLFAAPVALLVAITGTPAHSQISESVFVSNNYGFNFDTQAPSLKAGRTKETFFEGNYPPGSQSELGLNYTGIADAGGFFFLHDNFCVGRCSTASETSIVFNVTNDSDGSQSLRFDSQITLGHLAKIFAGAGMNAGFTFKVLKVQFEQTQTLYSASGLVNEKGVFLDTGGLTFNGLRAQSGPHYELLDWSTTNLSVDLGSLTGGSSMQVLYEATYWSQSDANCGQVFVCPGVQVVFGDPRNNGGTNLADPAAALFDAPSALDPGRAVIGAEYAASFVPFAIVRSDAPPSFTQPDPGPPLDYVPLYRSRLQAVPEPATWAMMIGGFAMAGGAMRRRKVSAAVC